METHCMTRLSSMTFSAQTLRALMGVSLLAGAALMVACGGLDYERDRQKKDDLNEPCENLLEDACIDADQCEPDYEAAPCPAIACDPDSPGCDFECDGEIFVACRSTDACENLAEESCIARDDCAPRYDVACPDCIAEDGVDCSCIDTFGGCEEVEPPSGCTSDADCGANEYCQINYSGLAADPIDCYCPPCEPGDDVCAGCACPEPPPVSEGECFPRPPEPECYSDADCGPNQHCEFGNATRPAPVPCDCAPCADPDNCGVCACEDDEDAIAAPGICVDDPVTYCGWDGDCAADEFCDFSGAGFEPERCFCEDCDESDPDCVCSCGGGAAPAGICQPRPQSECYSDADCSDGYACVYPDGDGNGDCACPPCQEGEECEPCDCFVAVPGVCQYVGQDECQTDADCGFAGYCEYGSTCTAIGCPPPPPNRCVYPNCDEPGELFCDAEPHECPEGQIIAAQDGCWVCVDPITCQPGGHNGQCDDGSQLQCRMAEPLCETGTIAAIQDGCWVCVDPDTCGNTSGMEFNHARMSRTCSPNDASATRFEIGNGGQCDLESGLYIDFVVFGQDPSELRPGTNWDLHQDDWAGNVTLCHTDLDIACVPAEAGYLEIHDTLEDGSGVVGSFWLHFGGITYQGEFDAPLCGDGFPGCG